jgi:hypothetical protein
MQLINYVEQKLSFGYHGNGLDGADGVGESNDEDFENINSADTSGSYLTVFHLSNYQFNNYITTIYNIDQSDNDTESDEEEFSRGNLGNFLYY